MKGLHQDRRYLSGIAVAHPKVVKSGEEVGSDGEDLRVELRGPRHGGSSRQKDDSLGSLRRETNSESDFRAPNSDFCHTSYNIVRGD